MSDDPATEHPSGPEAIAGRMLLYRQPQLLANEDHGHLGLSAVDAPFEFARHARAIPLVAGEFTSAQRYFPIVFDGAPNPMPFAIVGLGEEMNLFVEADGHWSVPGYIPAYLRCYPFALATAADERFAVVFDRAAPMVSGEPQQPFFTGTKISEFVQRRIDLCRDYEAEKQRTRTFMATLARLELLTPQKAARSVDGQEQALARYLAVDREKLGALAPDVVAELFRDGSLATIMAHLFSLETFAELLRRRELADRPPL